MFLVGSLVEDAGETAAPFDDGKDFLNGNLGWCELHGRLERALSLLLLGGRLVEP